MDDEEPPPLPPRKYKLNKLTQNITNENSEQPLIQLEGGGGGGGEQNGNNNNGNRVCSNISSGNQVWDDFANLTLTKSSVSNDSYFGLFRSYNKAVELAEFYIQKDEKKDNGGRNDLHLKFDSTLSSCSDGKKSAFDSKNYDKSITKNKNIIEKKALTLDKNCLEPLIDDMITKNFNEFFNVDEVDYEEMVEPVISKSIVVIQPMNEIPDKQLPSNLSKDEILPLKYSNSVPTKAPPLPPRKSSTLPASTERKVLREHETKSEVFESLFDKVVETNEDIIDFGIAITDLRKTFKYDDITTNSGLTVPYVVQNSLPYADVNIPITIYFQSKRDDEKTMQCGYSWTAKEICNHFFSTFFSEVSSMDLFLYSNQYIFKMIGLDMYLLPNVALCDHSHIQEYLKQGKTIRLDLVSKSDSHVSKNLSRTDKDDLMLRTCDINFEYFFEKPDMISVSEQGLSILLESFDKEVAALINNIPGGLLNVPEGHFVPDRMIQVVKAISTVLATIDVPQIQNAIQLLKSLTTHSGGGATDESNASGGENFQCEPISLSDIKEVKHFDKSLFDLGLQQLAHGLYYLVELYCKSFGFKFDLGERKILPESYTADFYQQVDKRNSDDVFERVDPRTIADKFVVKIESVHRIPSEWKFNFVDFQLEVGLYYGGSLLCPVVKCTKSTVDKGFFEHITFAKLIEFDIAVRQIPRETKIGFILHGLISPVNSTSLCWFTCNIYDYQGFLVSGSRLFGLLHDVDFDPFATCATSYLHQCDTVILHVNFQIYPIEVMFPQPVLFLTSDLPQEKELRAYDLNRIRRILQKDFWYLTENEKNFIWNNRSSLSEYPKALVYVLLSVPSWDAESVLVVHSLLNYWKNLHPHNALKLLEGNFPDKIIRGHAVLCLSSISDDELFDFLPGLVQALKYEAYHNCALALFLIKRALCSVRLCHYLYWYLKYYVEDIQFCQRYKTTLSGLLHVCGQRLRREFTKQENLISGLVKTANLIKESRDSLRRAVLEHSLEKLNDELETPFCVPYDPAIKVNKTIPDASSYFNSYTVPLKVVFENSDPLADDIGVIFKVGDDLRKDLLTIHIFRVMNMLWLNNGLDLRIMLYNVLPTGPYMGFIEIVPNATTLREIHVQYGGVTGSFKQESLSLWLQQFNATRELYQKAIENFTASAAGYCVATYVLGIGDRHNDNIMITKNGHLFHIDFSKYMGDIQRFGAIKRDRVPFVLTPDMAYVINNGLTPSQNFQTFIEYCCKAFNILRRNRTKLLNILSLMMYADIAYVSPKADIEYVYQSLQLQLSDAEADVFFSQLIQNSLSSMSTQLNFFIHNVAHMKDSTLKKAQSVFSFSQETHSFGSGSGVHSARVVDFQKRYIPGKHYMFVINVLKSEESNPNFLFRRYEDFQELHTNICNNFAVFDIELPQLLQKFVIGRSEVREVAQERRLDLDRYLVELSKIPVVWSSEIMATFLHSYIRDDEEEERFNESVAYLQQGWKSRIGGKVKISMVYERRDFKVYIMHVCDLVPRGIQGLADSYVKAYLLPDFAKHTKRKTKICHKSLNPTFNETFTYNVPMELLKNRVLEVTVWDQVTMTDKEFLGGFKYYLSQFNPQHSTSGWFTMVDIELDR